MRRATTLGILIATSVGALFAQSQQAPPPQQTFRTTTDAIIVDASVRAGGRMVPELALADFVLTDNGVRQTIDNVEPSAVPIDLTLVVDTSGSWARPRIDYLDRSKIAHALGIEIRQVVNLLRPTNRIRVLAVDRYVRQLAAFAPVSSYRNIRVVEMDGLGSTFDTLAAALLHNVEPWRRHVVIARTKGRDSMSTATAEAVGAIAERSEALFHLVVMEAAMDSEDALHDFQVKAMLQPWPTNRFWIPFRRSMVGAAPSHVILPAGLAIKAGAEASGGGWHQGAIFSQPTMVGTFKKAFEDFRQGYVLRYTPRGVPASGWHSISVTVPKLRNASVNARKGYGIEPPRAPAPKPVAAIPRTLAELTHAYEREAFQNVSNSLRQGADAANLMKEFEEGGNPWPATPRREASFAIELAEAGFFSARSPVREQAEALLTRFSRLVRHPYEADAFERQWHYAVLTLLQATLRPAVLGAFSTRAIDRFPDEPRFLLARAIAADQVTAVGGALRWSSPNPGMRTNLETAKRLFEELLGMPDVAAEARIRLAFLLHRQGAHEQALSRLNEFAATANQEAMLRYLHQLFRGHVLIELGRVEDGLNAYRAALAIAPSAQSARTSLMNGLYRVGDRQQAEALAEIVQIQGSQFIDPWWLYWQGQYRLHAQVMARLREMAR